MSPLRPDVRLVGQRLDPAAHALRDFLTRIAQPHTWFEAGTPEAAAELERAGAADAALPVLLDGDRVLTPATVSAVAEGWRMSDPPRQAHYDLAIIGAGPAGLAAAVYAASDGLRTLLVEREVPGGQASHTSLIENFIGFPDGIAGAELARLAGRQAEGFGAELVLMRGVQSSSMTAGGRFCLTLDGGHGVTADVAVAAPGMVWRQLHVPGVEELLGRGVYYGAGRSEAQRCARDRVVVVGAGNSAGQAVMHLADAGATVTMLVRGDRLGRTMSDYLVKRIEAHPQITVRFGAQVQEAHGDGSLSEVTVAGATGSAERLPARALFVCIGGQPRTGWAADVGVRTDGGGYLLTGPDLLDAGRRPDGWPLDRDPLALETDVPGLFAAGDARHGSTKRVGGAAGEGAMAAALVHHRLAELSSAR